MATETKIKSDAPASEPTQTAVSTIPAVERKLSETATSSVSTAPATVAAPGQAVSPPIVIDSLPELRELCQDARLALNPMASPSAGKLVIAAEKNVQSTLARVDELNAFLESLRSNSASASASLIPNLRGRSKQVERLFQRIDDFQGFVDVVEKSVDQMEKRLDQMEEAYGKTDVKKFFTSILTSFTSEAPPAKFVWTPVDFIEKADTHFS